ncbi:hypothetical protein AMATHDRAFT_41523 [Amanita thiersii Skay4041]|uniref:Uncharacterized protein n=1 Tax=Amanita thiersii Skay4041 TaxID=703135 RepID=A0A2A9NHC5_9AGAR|nr:hypothetical protein AMATHDRAFT_41523 [Amanita thiersii Skay4041]
MSRMAEYVSTTDTIKRISSGKLEPGELYAVLTYRGDLASWNWAFFIPDPSVSPIGSTGTIFHVIHDNDAVSWKFEKDEKDVVSSPMVVAIVRLANVSFLGDYEDIVHGDTLLGMFKQVGTPTSSRSIHPAEFSSRVWFLEAIAVLHDCGVLTCDDVWLLEREIRRCAFAAMDKYLDNGGGGFFAVAPTCYLLDSI